MNNALTISGLTKTYKGFVLDNVSFSVPSGSIVGLIGENGAGKSTTINAALGLIQKEAGHVSILGKDELDNKTKEQIGVVFDGSNYPEILSPKKMLASGDRDHILSGVFNQFLSEKSEPAE